MKTYDRYRSPHARRGPSLQRRITEMLQVMERENVGTFILKVMARLMSDGDCPDFSHREYVNALEALETSGAIIIHGQKIEVGYGD